MENSSKLNRKYEILKLNISQAALWKETGDVDANMMEWRKEKIGDRTSFELIIFFICSFGIISLFSQTEGSFSLLSFAMGSTFRDPHS